MSPDYRANKYSFLKRLGYERRYGNELIKLIREVKPDVILSGQTPSEPQLAMVQAAAALGIPVITWVQDFYSLAVDKLARKKLPLLGALAGAWYRRLDRRCFQASAGLVVITEDFTPILQGFGVPAEKITVIPNWASLDELPRRAKQNPWSSRHGLADKFVFLYSGTLAMKHNPELLRLLARQYQDDPAVRVVVISEGPGADYLQRRKAVEGLDNLLLLPFQVFTEMPDVLGSADVLVTVLEADAGVFSVPSKVLTYHTAERAILGAMPAKNLAAHIIQVERSGLCVAPDNSAAFLQAASTLRKDPALRESLGRNARAYAEREFDLAKITDRFEALFRKATHTT